MHCRKGIEDISIKKNLLLYIFAPIVGLAFVLSPGFEIDTFKPGINLSDRERGGGSSPLYLYLNVFICMWFPVQ